MRRKDRALTPEQALEIIKRAEYGVLTTVNAEGWPNSVPFNFAVEGGKIYLHCSVKPGATLENLKLNDRVCFTLVGETRLLPEKFATLYESAVVHGKARLAGDEKEFRLGLELLLKKYSPDYPAEGQRYIEKMYEHTAVIVIDIMHIAGKARRPETPSNLKHLNKE